MMLSHHGALDKLKLFHLEDGGFYHPRDYKLPLNRQVQITAGIIIVLGIVLTQLMSWLFIIIPLFIGCGLIFAGISGWCGMASLLALMPWN